MIPEQLPTSTADLASAARFIQALAPSGAVTFQTFDDTPAKRPGLARVMHCRQADATAMQKTLAQLAELNTQGAGVFVTVNATDGKARTTGSVQAVRALFVDLDDFQPARDLAAFGFAPSLVVESSPGKHHVYWCLDDLAEAWPLAEFKPAQQRLAASLGGDPACTDLPRVLRVPGFVHQKGEPFVSRMVLGDGPQHTVAALRDWIATMPDAGRATAANDSGPPRPQGLSVGELRLRLATVRKSARSVYADWLAVGMALHHETTGSDSGLELWDEWSSAAANYAGLDDLARRWEGFGKGTSRALVTISTLAGMGDPDDPDCEAARNALVALDFEDVSGSAPPPKPHPWAQFIELRAVPRAPRFVIPWFIQEGIVVIAGAPGVGKTTALLPLALTAAGLHREGDPLAPEHWRHVCYLTEEPEQVARLLAAAARCPELPVSFGQIAERVHVAPLHRLAPAQAVKVGAYFAEAFTRTIDGNTLPPLVVLDTQAAALALENENANSEVSAAVAAFKQGFADLPVWFVSHTAKTQWEGSDPKALTARGGGSWGGDAQQVLFAVEDCGRFYLRRGKTRFEARWPELEITTAVVSVPMLDPDGAQAEHPVRWASLEPVGVAQGAADRKDDTLRIALSLVAQEHETGNPVSTAVGGPGNSGQRLRSLSKTLERMPSGAVHELLMEAEVRGLLIQEPRQSAGKRSGASWAVSQAGRTFLETL